MYRQKTAIIFFSIIGIGGTFLPWIKTPLLGTIVGISSPGDKTMIWIPFTLFMISAAICFINKSVYFRRWALFWSLLPAVISAVYAILLLRLKFESLDFYRIEALTGISGLSELGVPLSWGPAPYFTLILGTSILIIGLALIPQKLTNKTVQNERQSKN